MQAEATPKRVDVRQYSTSYSDDERELDPQRRLFAEYSSLTSSRALLFLVRQCEAYSNQIRGILHQWKVKSEQVERGQSGLSTDTEIELLKQPENLKNELRSYQLIGLNWLYLLFQQKINGILADESNDFVTYNDVFSGSRENHSNNFSFCNVQIDRRSQEATPGDCTSNW